MTDSKERALLEWIVEFISEHEEWFFAGTLPDSPEVIWLEEARELLGLPELELSNQD